MSKNTITALNNLGWNVTSGAVASIIDGALDTLQSKLANGGRDEKVKFYWDYNKGGSIWNVVARTVVGGAVDVVAKEALSQYKKLIGGDTVQSNNNIGVEKANALAKAARAEDEANYGHFTINDGANTIDAYDQWGEVCVDALMLGIPLMIKIRHHVPFHHYLISVSYLSSDTSQKQE